MFAFANSFSVERLLTIFAAVLLQQISVGLSNDWLDYKLDKTANRVDKATVSGLVKVSWLRVGSLTSAVLAQLVAITLGGPAAIVMLLMLVFGWSYNLGLKANWLSALPYALGFGTIPIFVGLAATEPFWVPVWMILVSALLGVSAHFANVLPDLAADKLTGVNALPHILGQKISAIVIAVTALLATVIIVTQSEQLAAPIAAVGLAITLALAGSASLLSLRPKPPRVVFPLLMLTALTNVILLVLGARAS
jgi:4-hydroxybenzoate polyprenyltransferase